MSVHRTQDYLISMLHELCNLPAETEWVEFKHNNHDPDAIGEYLSALSNSAAINGKSHAYLVWGINDENHEILGTSFKPSKAKKGNQEARKLAADDAHAQDSLPFLRV